VVGLAGATAFACQQTAAGWQRRLLSGMFAFGLFWTALSALAVWPHGLCYVNEIWGGTRNGYLALSDSNYDWGQGLKELARWQKKRQLAVLDVWYFGSDPALKRMPVREVPLHVMPLDRPEEVLDRVNGRYLAASTTMVYGNVTITPQHRRAAMFLRAIQPVDRTTTFLIYDLDRIRAQRGSSRVQEASAAALSRAASNR
jgi:hypothetical protein